MTSKEAIEAINLLALSIAHLDTVNETGNVRKMLLKTIEQFIRKLNIPESTK